MTIAVKICGITSAGAIDAAVAAGATYGGLVLFEKSPRGLGLEAAAQLAAHMRGKLRLVSLVVDENDDQLGRIAKEIRPDFFQLHGRETPARVADIRARFHIPVIKALAVAEAADLAQVSDYENVADMLMFDARPPKGAERPGGHGAAFDWKILSGRSFTKPWFLAGGLDPDNVARALELSGAAMVDVSSGVESAPGVKDAARIAQFINATRGYARA
jgi:phosphoribosylanthranilate isomerase